jgi:uncharacterized protein YuzE
MEKNYFYDEFSDRFMISCKKSDEKVVGSVRVLNVTIDFASNGKIVNVEIRNISDYLSSLGLSSNVLTDLEDAQLMFKQYRDGYVLYFILKPKHGNIERIPFNVPMKQALLTA